MKFFLNERINMRNVQSQLGSTRGVSSEGMSLNVQSWFQPFSTVSR